MRTTPALRTLAVTLFAGGTFAVVATGTTAFAAPPTYADGHGGDGGGSGPTWGTVISATPLNVRVAPTTGSSVVDRLSPGSQDRLECAVRGQSVDGNPYWYWLTGAQGWASASAIDTGGRAVSLCSDPCPVWKDDSWHPSNGDKNPWDRDRSAEWNISGSWNFSISGSSSSGLYSWVPDN
ncbi:SH3 domain-containing protein [Streptomyces sp. NPDC008150]|uniref:SH3 domain-containing protein n=1 Tax=Streptomyces sp. NPDC008150 TaxID=3364816 RepID=UPI0036EF3A72